MRRARDQAAQAAARHPTAANLDNAAVAMLVAGQLDAAIPLLEQAAGLAPGSAGVLSDLAAAHLASAQAPPASSADHEPRLPVEDLLEAIAAAQDALTADASSPAARFNLALAAELLGLRETARDSWRRVAAQEPRSPWADEALRRLAAMDGVAQEERVEGLRARLLLAALAGDTAAVSRAVAADPGLARAEVEENLLGGWAEAEAEAPAGGSSVAPALLRAARRTAQALAALNGERMGVDAVAAIDRARRQGPAATSRIALAHRELRRGLVLERRDAFLQAAAHFAAAADALRAAGSPMAGWAELHLGVCAYYQPDYARARAIFTALRDTTDRTRYPALVGRAAWMAALTDLVSDRLPEALLSCQQALAIFTALREDGHAGFLHMLLASCERALGNRAAGWEHRYQGLRMLARQRDPRRFYSILHEASEAALEEGWPAASLALLAELLRSPGLETMPVVVAETHIRMASVETQLRHPGLADRHLRDAALEIDRIADPSLRGRVSADLAAARGSVLLDRAPAEALTSLDAALEFYTAAGYRLESATVRGTRAAADHALHRDEAAAAELETALAELDRLRRAIADDATRVAFYAQAQKLVDQLVWLQLVARGSPPAAFEAAESRHARSLLDAVAAGSEADEDRAAEASPASYVATLVRSLPGGVAIVEYAALPDRLAIWVLRRDGLRTAEVPLQASELAALVAGFRESLRHAARDASSRDQAARLYETLVRPVAGALAGARRLVFVPDKALYELPFALLADRTTGRRLIDDFDVAAAPSATVFLQAMRRRREPAAGVPAALVVTNDRLDPRIFPHLGPLPWAHRESAAIARVLPGSVLLADERATRQRVLSLAPRFDVIHFATHAWLPARASPALLLSPATGPGESDAGLLRAEDLQALRLPRTRLVVLAACGTAAGANGGPEGPMSLARAVLATRAPAVIATLWEVDDEASARLLSLLYRGLAAGVSPGSAFRAAQRQCLAESGAEASQDRGSCAAFELIGATP